MYSIVARRTCCRYEALLTGWIWMGRMVEWLEWLDGTFLLSRWSSMVRPIQVSTGLITYLAGWCFLLTRPCSKTRIYFVDGYTYTSVMDYEGWMISQHSHR